jgi:predicted  nucleic acid-binding Zn-ribbon protein
MAPSNRSATAVAQDLSAAAKEVEHALAELEEAKRVERDAQQARYAIESRVRTTRERIGKLQEELNAAIGKVG